MQSIHNRNTIPYFHSVSIRWYLRSFLVNSTMHESLHEYMKVGLVHFMAFPECMGGDGPIIESAKSVLRDPFFEVLEITRIKDVATRRELRALAEQARVELGFGAQPILLGGKLDLNHPDKSERGKALDAVRAGIEEAASMGIRSVAILSGPVSADYDAAKQWLTESIGALCDYAAPRNIAIVLETFDQVPFGKNCLIGPTRDAIEVSKAIRASHPSFGLLLDLSHLPLLSESSGAALRMAKEHLTHVHIGNCAMDDPAHPAYGDNHPRFGAAGTRNDVKELAEFLRVLIEIGYLKKGERRIVSFEVKPMAGESSEAVIAGSKRALEAAWRLV